jgi:hypothetical protein
MVMFASGISAAMFVTAGEPKANTPPELFHLETGIFGSGIFDFQKS